MILMNKNGHRTMTFCKAALTRGILWKALEINVTWPWLAGSGVLIKDSSGPIGARSDTLDVDQTELTVMVYKL